MRILDFSSLLFYDHSIWDTGMLRNKNAVITGASRGIGRGIAEVFAEHGAFVGINYVSDKQAALKTLQRVRSAGGEGILLKGDVAKPSEVNTMVSKYVEVCDQLDILVNNAGVYKRNDFETLSYAAWQRSMHVNLTGCYHMCSQLIPYMSAGGRIIFISSQLAFRGTSHGADYAASKAGMLGLMRSLALELAAKKITVNAVAPGTIDTDIIAGYSKEKRNQRSREIPLGRIGQPEDVADAVLFLASDLARYITGETINVNGGLYIH